MAVQDRNLLMDCYRRTLMGLKRPATRIGVDERLLQMNPRGIEALWSSNRYGLRNGYRGCYGSGTTTTITDQIKRWMDERPLRGLSTIGISSQAHSSLPSAGLVAVAFTGLDARISLLIPIDTGGERESSERIDCSDVRSGNTIRVITGIPSDKLPRLPVGKILSGNPPLEKDVISVREELHFDTDLFKDGI